MKKTSTLEGGAAGFRRMSLADALCSESGHAEKNSRAFLVGSTSEHLTSRLCDGGADGPLSADFVAKSRFPLLIKIFLAR